MTGVSGSGKSTLVNDILYRSLARRSTGRATSRARTIASKASTSSTRSSRSISRRSAARRARNPATYTGLFTFIRDLFAMMPDAKARGFRPGRFSFNVKGGRCEACQGDGVIAIEMHFLPDVYVTCEQCKGRRYNRETLEIKYRGKSIADVLELTVDQALPLLENFPPIANKLRTLQDVGLGYIELGQSATTLSGGEAQRVKLSKELSKRGTGRHALHPRRADDRAAFRGHAEAARRAEQARRPGQHDRRHRAQPRRDQVGRLRDRSRARKAAPAAAASSPRAPPRRSPGTRRRRPDAILVGLLFPAQMADWVRPLVNRCGKIATTLTSRRVAARTYKARTSCPRGRCSISVSPQLYQPLSGPVLEPRAGHRLCSSYTMLVPPRVRD